MSRQQQSIETDEGWEGITEVSDTTTVCTEGPKAEGYDAVQVERTGEGK